MKHPKIIVRDERGACAFLPVAIDSVPVYYSRYSSSSSKNEHELDDFVVQYLKRHQWS